MSHNISVIFNFKIIDNTYYTYHHPTSVDLKHEYTKISRPLIQLLQKHTFAQIEPNRTRSYVKLGHCCELFEPAL